MNEKEVGANSIKILWNSFIEKNPDNKNMNLHQITVPSLYLTKSIPFYRQLELKLIVKSLPNYAIFECPNGNSIFSIHQTEI